MGLETFTQETNVEPKVEDGFIITPKGNKFPIGKKRKKVGNFFVSTPTRAERIMQQFPEVDRWLRTRYNSSNTWHNYSVYLIDFCIARDITPKEFAELRHSEKEQDKAIDLASEYIQDLLFKKKYNQALGCKKALKSFYEFHSKGRKILVLDTKGSLKIKVEDARSKEKPRYSWGPTSEVRRKTALIIPSARDLFDRMALTFLFRTACRRNVLTHLKIKDVQDRFELENPITHKKEEVLCLTISGYNRDTKEGLCEKTEHYHFPTLLDDPKQRHGYYTFLAKDSLQLFDKFMEKYHPNPKPDDYVFYRLSDKTKPLNVISLSKRYKAILKRLDFPQQKITLHQYKQLFTGLAEATLSKEDSYHVEFLTGHLLDGAKEHYHKRNKIADGQAYLKIDFGGSITEKEEEIERLQEQVKALSQAQVEAKKKLTIPSGPLGGPPPTAKEPGYEEPKRDFQQAKPHLPKNKPNMPPLAISKPSVSMKTTKQDDWVVCPDRDDWVRKSVECRICGDDNFKKFSECYKERVKHPFSELFKCSKPKPKL